MLYFIPKLTVKYTQTNTQTDSRNTFQAQKQSESHSVVSNSLQPHGLYSLWNSPGQNTAVGSLSLLQGSFPTWSRSLLHCGWILYQLSYQRSPQLQMLGGN